MKPAAIGIRVHSGWGVLVAVSGERGAEEVIERRKVVVIDPKATGVTQPYHYVQEMELRAAERHLARCTADSRRLALQGLKEALAHLHDLGCNVIGGAILLSSAQPLPDLEEILGSHALIHTAEGEFFRHSFRQAFERLDIPVIGIRERELMQSAHRVFGKAASRLEERIEAMGKAFGPPWTKDEKTAAMAASIVLAGADKPGAPPLGEPDRQTSSK